MGGRRRNGCIARRDHERSRRRRFSSRPARPHRAASGPRRRFRPSPPPRARLPLQFHPCQGWPCCLMRRVAGERWLERSECTNARLLFGWVGNWGRARWQRCWIKSELRVPHTNTQLPHACHMACRRPAGGMRRPRHNKHCHCSTPKPLQRACLSRSLCCNPCHSAFLFMGSGRVRVPGACRLVRNALAQASGRSLPTGPDCHLTG